MVEFTEFTIPRELVPRELLCLEVPLNGLIYKVPGDDFLNKEFCRIKGLCRTGDYQALLVFSLVHNRIVEAMPAFLEDFLKLYEMPCKIIGHSYASLCLALARVTYYENYFNQWTPNPRKIYDLGRQLETVIPNALAKGPLVEWASHVPELPPLTGPFHVPEYCLALNEFSSFLCNAYYAARFDPLLAKWWEFYVSAGKDMMLASSRRKIEGELIHFFCKSCNRPFFRLRTRGNAQGFCSPECKRKADSKKLSKRNRRQKLAWISTESKKRCAACKGVRFVNNEKICRKCFVENQEF